MDPEIHTPMQTLANLRRIRPGTAVKAACASKGGITIGPEDLTNHRGATILGITTIDEICAVQNCGSGGLLST